MPPLIIAIAEPSLPPLHNGKVGVIEDFNCGGSLMVTGIVVRQLFASRTETE